MKIIELLHQMEEHQASDLFLTVNKKPAMRVFGQVQMVSDQPLDHEDFTAFFQEYLPPSIQQRLEIERDMDIGISLTETDRYRLNLFYQKGNLSMITRRVPSGDLDFSQLRLPAIVSQLAETPRGLILITGSTSSGKSSTMAAIINHINTHFHKHIVTIEDPIEFIHRDKMSIVTQREIGNDTLSFTTSLKNVVRQSPDVIILGELRDLESVQIAVSAALTGHLVVTTMHTIDTTQTIERIINFFPDSSRDQISADLALALCGIISQRLVPMISGKGSVVAVEVLVATPLVQRLIIRRELSDLDEAMKAGTGVGMQTFNRSLTEMYRDNLISAEDGAIAATNRDEFLLSIQGMETGIETLRQLDSGEESREIDMRKLLKSALKHKASDIILTVGSAPVLRINGQLNELNLESLKPKDTQRLLFSVLSTSQRAHFESEKEIDFALSISNFDKSADPNTEKSYRFRVNGFYQKGAVACALRVVSQIIPSAADLSLPSIIMQLAAKPTGLILITGPTGHGKSTTLACIIDAINHERSCHIITIEDPIEYVHTSKKAIIEQREVHADTKSFTTALKYILRQNPDVILVGEMRDQETISAALTAAETGHLVLATLHTNDAVQTVDRIIDTFPPHQQNQVRTQLASCLRAVVAQRLVQKSDATGRIGVFEIMIGTTAIQALIRDNRTHQMLSAIETSAKDGMMTFDKSLSILYKQQLISKETALALARDPNLLVDRESSAAKS